MWQKTDTATNQDLVPPLFVNRHPTNTTHDHSAFIFAARSDTRAVVPQEAESLETEYRWCTEKDLAELLKIDPRMRPEIRRYALAALAVCAR
jgi:hypothetical protein